MLIWISSRQFTSVCCWVVKCLGHQRNTPLTQHEEGPGWQSEIGSVHLWLIQNADFHWSSLLHFLSYLLCQPLGLKWQNTSHLQKHLSQVPHYEASYASTPALRRGGNVNIVAVPVCNVLLQYVILMLHMRIHAIANTYCISYVLLGSCTKAKGRRLLSLYLV